MIQQRKASRRLSWWGVAGIACALTGAFTGFRANAQDIAITNARLVIGDGSAPVDGGTVVVRGGKVVAAGANVTVPAGIETVDAGGQMIDLNLEITQADNDFTGTMASPVGGGKIEKGKVDGNTVTGTIQADVQGSPTTIEMSGTLEGDKMKGTLNVPGFGRLPFTAARPMPSKVH